MIESLSSSAQFPGRLSALLNVAGPSLRYIIALTIDIMASQEKAKTQIFWIGIQVTDADPIIHHLASSKKRFVKLPNWRKTNSYRLYPRMKWVTTTTVTIIRVCSHTSFQISSQQNIPVSTASQSPLRVGLEYNGLFPNNSVLLLLCVFLPSTSGVSQIPHWHCLVSLHLSTYLLDILCLSCFEHLINMERMVSLKLSNRRWCPNFLNSIIQVPICWRGVTC